MTVAELLTHLWCVPAFLMGAIVGCFAPVLMAAVVLLAFLPNNFKGIKGIKRETGGRRDGDK